MMLIIIFVVVWLGAIPVFIHTEKKKYNNGVCGVCGGKLHYAQSDSQGGDLWMCDDCGSGIWLSWFHPTEEKTE